MTSRRKNFLLYIAKCSLDRNEPMYDRQKPMGLRIAWMKNVRAETRSEALEKCLPEIIKLTNAITDPTIKYVSVYVGSKHGTGAAERLQPIQVTIATRTIRKRGEL